MANRLSHYRIVEYRWTHNIAFPQVYLKTDMPQRQRKAWDATAWMTDHAIFQNHCHILHAHSDGERRNSSVRKNYWEKGSDNKKKENPSVFFIISPVLQKN